ncbi:MAG: EAL domain-containing protein [Lachnospiraceae bacterium]|nr:EAL domain-containing protein [Lachnospiraceae bacterium]
MEMHFSDSEKMKRFILIVDDEEINRDILGSIFEEEYHIFYAQNGREALDLIKENSSLLSAILLDLMMPEMTGMELLEVLKEEQLLKKIPVLVMTADENSEVDSLKIGAVDFITKPYGMPEAVRARVARSIELFEDRQFIRATGLDELTGLYSKSFFYEYAQMMDRYNPDMDTDAVVLDIDHFHLVNEIYGRDFGDDILREISHSIKEFLKQSDGIACRSEADVFLLYAEHRDGYDDLQEKVSEGLQHLSETPHVRVRIGTYTGVKHDIDMERRFACAKLACNTLRGNFMQNSANYDKEMREKFIFSERIVNDIHDALKEHQLIVYYQPKYNITGDKPKLASAEALIRWQHPEYGMLGPFSFMPLFEENGLVQMVDEYVWRESAEQIRKWKDTYGYAVPISVNVSRIDLYNPNLGAEILAMLEENGLGVEDMYLEITESAYANNAKQMIAAVEKLRGYGFKIEMDDFGTGYSSLNMLFDLPVDVLKMDMRFAQHIHENPKALQMVSVVMDIAETMQVPVIAEGVELQEQFDLLKERGCQYIQGYYFSKPIPADEFEVRLQNDV